MIPKAVILHPDASTLPLADLIRRHVPASAITVSPDDPCTLKPDVPPWQLLRIRPFQGDIIKRLDEKECSFPGREEGYLACGINCPGRCAYCFLKACATVAYPELYAGLPAMLDALRRELAASPGIYLHLGHVLDPLAYPFLGPFIHGVIQVLRGFPEATLEIRTKYADLSMLPEDPPANVILAFSFSPAGIAAACETGVPSLKARLRAARSAAGLGYRIGIRLDPILLAPNWREDYAALCATLTQTLPHTAVADAVIGTFRGPPALITTLLERAADPIFRHAEFVPIGPGKMGYADPIRIQALRFIASRLGGRYSLRLCFESARIQDAVFSRHAGGH